MDNHIQTLLSRNCPQEKIAIQLSVAFEIKM